MRYLDQVEDWVFVDPANSTGLCLVHDGEMTLDTISVKAGNDRATQLLLYFHDLANELKIIAPRVVCVESYAIEGRGTAAQSQVELGAVARIAGADSLADVVEMNISLWKSITFKGKKDTKAARADYCYKAEQVLEQRPANVDEADAGLMAYAAAVILGDRTRWTKGMQRFREDVEKAVAGGRGPNDLFRQGGSNGV